jgi:hypothetical protein
LLLWSGTAKEDAMRTATTLTACFAILTLLVSGCLETEEPNPGGNSETIEFHPIMSDCGGFDREASDDLDDSAGYCDAELLNWRYDAERSVLELTDSRVLLNCCGVHSMDARLVDGVFVVTEYDAAEDAGRCDCMCVFDYSIAVHEVPNANVPVVLQRHVTDSSDAPMVIWEGTLDVTAGEGVVTVDDTDVGVWCEEEPATELDSSDEVSDCGGFPEMHEPPAHDGPVLDYCGAERLFWDYDASSSTFGITNTRVTLNCCGVHSTDIELVDGVYVVTETDEPEFADGRCDCECVYDFALIATGIPTGSIDVRLERLITEVGAPFVVWEGSLDLSSIAGDIVISDEPAPCSDEL